MSRFYLIIHLCIGICIIIFEFFYRWIIEKYQIYIRTCSDVFSIEFKQINNHQSLNLFEKQLNNFIERFSSFNKQCLIKEFKLNLNFIFIFLRYLWFIVTSLYFCFSNQPNKYKLISHSNK